MKTLSRTLAAAGLAAFVSCTVTVQEPDRVSLVPMPENVVLQEGGFNIAGAAISIAPELQDAAAGYISDFAAQLSASTTKESRLAEDGTVRFVYDPDLAPEAYRLEVRDGQLVAEASGLNGVIYAVQTLKQLLPAEVYSGKPAPEADWTVRGLSIEDSPRFAYRGLMLDCSRHFFSTDEVKKIIDVMEIHKLNCLHWHLTDDQGWRVEIRKYPELTKVGAYRDGTCIKKNVGTSDGIRYGGFYTQDELKEVVAYAAAKGINVMPEIDLPGHMLAALASYPELGCTGGPYRVWQRWGISDDVLCVGKEETFRFLENVLTEICEIFPSEYIHIGGDECPKTRWENCPACQKRIEKLGLKDDGKHTAEHYLQSYVTERIGKFLAGKGRKIIGWDEILEGKVPDGATVMSWRGSEGGIAAAASGHDAIMTPTTHFYLDYYQSRNQDKEPLAIGGYNPVEQVYSYEMDMDEASMKHILGVQANMWTEYVTTDAYLEYMILPRLAALSEVQWCPKGTRDWKRFRASMDNIRGIYDELGYNYAKHMFEGEPDPEIIQ